MQTDGCIYISIYDANADLDNDVWLERTCNDEYCDFCSLRPEKPSDMNDLHNWIEQ